MLPEINIKHNNTSIMCITVLWKPPWNLLNWWKCHTPHTVWTDQWG